MSADVQTKHPQHGWPDHVWTETHRTESSIQYACACGAIVSRGPGKIEREEDAFARRVVDAVVADLKANGRIRMAMVGVYDEQEKHA